MRVPGSVAGVPKRLDDSSSRTGYDQVAHRQVPAGALLFSVLQVKGGGISSKCVRLEQN